VKFGSAAILVYRTASGGRVRFTVSWYREGRRMRQVFGTLEEAKKEALFVARRIQLGMPHLTDLNPHDREAYLAARTLADEAGLPLVAAVEDYLRARQIAGSESLAAMAAEYSKHFGNLTRRATVPEVVAQLIASKTQDGSSARHLAQIRSMLTRFAAAHPGVIPDVTSSDIDAWLRSLEVSPSSRNSMLVHVNLLFSYALEQNSLPAGRPISPSQLRKVNVADSENEIFQPHEFRRIIHAAPAHLIPLLSISAFAGIRAAELVRLDWSAVNLERRLIQIRAGQAKTASRRLMPITENLAEWLQPLQRNGRVITSGELIKEATPSPAPSKSIGRAT
jgi:site-specific recombinase XerD